MSHEAMIPKQIADQIRRNTPSRIINHGKEQSLDSIEQRKQNEEAFQTFEEDFSKRWQIAEETKRRIEENDWKIHTQNRPIPNHGEVFFTEEQDCKTPGCTAGKICYPLSGYNPWRSHRGYELDTKYNASDKSRHFCKSDTNTSEYCDILSARITELEDQLKKQANDFKEEIRRAFFVTATHGV